MSKYHACVSEMSNLCEDELKKTKEGKVSTRLKPLQRSNETENHKIGSWHTCIKYIDVYING